MSFIEYVGVRVLMLCVFAVGSIVVASMLAAYYIKYGVMPDT